MIHEPRQKLLEDYLNQDKRRRKDLLKATKNIGNYKEMVILEGHFKMFIIFQEIMNVTVEIRHVHYFRM